MAYDKQNLVGNVQGAIFGYSSADAKATVAGADYFVNSYIELNTNAVILAKCSDGIALLTVSAVDKTAPGSVTAGITMEVAV